MNIAFIGIGKLGFPCAVALAMKGHTVYAFDKSEALMEGYRRGEVTPFEPGLAAQYENAKDRMVYCTSTEEAVRAADVIFVAVPTPHGPTQDGSFPYDGVGRDFDNAPLRTCLVEVGKAIAGITDTMKMKTILVISTTTPGTMRDDLGPAMAEAVGRPIGMGWTMLYNPFFIGQSTVVADFLNPEFVLLGKPELPYTFSFSDENRAARQWFAQAGEVGERVARELYGSLHASPICPMTWTEAETVKLSYNTLLGLKVLFANTVMELCHKIGANCDVVNGALKLAKDRLISPKYMDGGMADGGPCFPGGEFVITEKGARPIEEVEVGDRVLTHDGSLQPVLQVWKRWYRGDLIGVKVTGMPESWMTEEHPVLARQDERSIASNGRRVTAQAVFNSDTITQEVRADALTTGHLIGWPTRCDSDAARPAHATPEYIELAGWYLSEGSVDLSARRGRLKFDLHREEVEDAERIATLLESCAVPRESGRGATAKITHLLRGENGRAVRLGSKGLAERLVADFGRGAAAKRMPAWALWGTEETASLLLRGLLRGDGHVNKNGTTYATISPALAYGVVVLLGRLGVNATLRRIAPRVSRAGQPHRESWEVCVGKTEDAVAICRIVGWDEGTIAPRQRLTKCDVYPLDNGSVWRPVRALRRRAFDGMVYNLWVDENNTYVMSCGAVHNCHGRDQMAMSFTAQRARLSCNIFDTINHGRDAQTRWLCDLIHGLVKGTTTPVVLLGMAFKPHTNQTQGSPAMLLANMLRGDGLEIIHHDPVLAPDVKMPEVPTVYFISTRWPEYRHWPFKACDIVIDPWRMFSRLPEGVVYIPIGGSAASCAA